MHLVAMMMLAICVPSIATGLAEVDDVAQALFEGDWQLHSFESDKSTGTLRIEDRGFRADGVHGWYEGHVTIRADTSPAQVDFTIADCECKFRGMTSAGIYYEDEGTIVFAAPAPGEPRPGAFTRLDEMVRLRPIDPATEGDDESPR